MNIRWFLAALAMLACARGDALLAAAPGRERSSEPSPAMMAKLLLDPSLRGRWGVTPADCDDSIDDNTGLMLVEASSLRFFGGVASPHVLDAIGPRRWRALFHHLQGTQKWSEVNTLMLHDNAQALTFAGEDWSRTYRRCLGRP